jgi:hypothetical protein
MRSKRLFRKKAENLRPDKKIHKEKIDKYPFVEVHWLDIVGEAGWQTFDQLHTSQLGRMISRGWLYSTDRPLLKAPYELLAVNRESRTAVPLSRHTDLKTLITIAASLAR